MVCLSPSCTTCCRMSCTAQSAAVIRARHQASFSRLGLAAHTVCVAMLTSAVSSQVFFTPLSQALRLIVHLGEPLAKQTTPYQFDFAVIILFFLLSFVLMVCTNGIGASTGMFVPALAVGAAGKPCPPPGGLVVVAFGLNIQMLQLGGEQTAVLCMFLTAFAASHALANRCRTQAQMCAAVAFRTWALGLSGYNNAVLSAVAAIAVQVEACMHPVVG